MFAERLRDLPIRRKLMLIGLVSNALVLVLLSSALGVREWLLYREQAVATLERYGAVIAGNAAAALMFDDERAAAEVLAGLRVEATIVAAELHDRAGKPVAGFAREGRKPPPELPPPGTARFFDDQLVHVRPVRHEREEVGRLLLQLDLHGVLWDMLRTQMLLAASMAVALGVAAMLFARFIRQVSEPVRELAAATRRVMREGDYTARVAVHGRDEIGILAGHFNTMLAALGEREAALAAHQAELEATVRERTEALERLNASLERRVAEEVANNREKDHLLIQQSRLAAMGEMIGSIAHQWRQPINTLALLLENLRDAQAFGELDAAYLDRSVEEGQAVIRRMSVTIDDFRHFFRPDKEKTRFTVGRAVGDVLGILDPAFHHNGISVRVEGGGDALVWGYPNEFAQVLLNLLANAKEVIVEREARDGEIVIAIAVVDGAVRIEVRDNAGGIAPGVIDRVFDPYFTTKEKGSGIGLYMSKMIIEGSMGGTIRAANRERGACFTITMPRAPDGG